MSTVNRPQFFTYSFGDQKIDIPLAYDEQGRPKTAYYIYDGKVIEISQEYDDQSRLKFACLNYGNEIYKLPVYEDTYGGMIHFGADGIDHPLRRIFAGNGRKISSCRSSVTYISPSGILAYRGYDIRSLIENARYLETVYLLLYGNRANKQQYEEFEKDIISRMPVDSRMVDILASLPRDMEFVAQNTQILVTTLGAFYPEGTINYTGPSEEARKARYTVAHNIIAKIPTIISMVFRHAKKEMISIIPPRDDLTYAQNFMNMCFARSETQPFKGLSLLPLMRAVEIMLILLHDHEQNASTASLRQTASTEGNPYSAFSSAIGTLVGILHGGANKEVIAMLEGVRSEEDVERLLKCVAKKESLLFGFGHPFYKKGDPRVPPLREIAKALEEMLNIENRMYPLAEYLERRVNEEREKPGTFFNEKDLHANVDFFFGIPLRALGFPKEMLPLFFALSRTAAWPSNLVERAENKGETVLRASQIYTGVPPDEREEFVPLEMYDPVNPGPRQNLMRSFKTGSLLTFRPQ